MEYNSETIDKLLVELLNGTPVSVISVTWKVPKRTLYFWIKQAGIDLNEIRDGFKPKVEQHKPKKKVLSYAEHLAKKVKEGRMTPQDRQKAIYKFKANFDSYVYTGDVEFNPEDLDK